VLRERLGSEEKLVRSAKRRARVGDCSAGQSFIGKLREELGEVTQ
jgi:hypothetical protein